MDQVCAPRCGENRFSRKTLSRCGDLACAALAATLLVGAIGSWLGSERSARAAERCGAELDREYARQLQRMDRATALQVNQQLLEQRGAVAGSLLQKTNASLILARVANSLPGGVSLVALGLDSQPAAGDAPDAATRITLQAVAVNQASVAQLIEALKAAPLFKQTRLVASRPGDPARQAASQVQVEMVLNDAPARTDRRGEASSSPVAAR